MKPQTSRILVVVLIALLIVVALGPLVLKHVFSTFVDIDIKTTPKVAGPKTLVTQKVPTNQVELPKAPAVAAKGEIAVANAASDLVDPRNDLKTALPDIARLFQADDYLDIYLTYSAPAEITPERTQRIKAALQAARANPVPYDLVRTQASGTFFESLEGLAPIYNEAGDEARYQATMLVPRPPDGVAQDAVLTTEVFVKVDGKWYWKGEVQPH